MRKRITAVALATLLLLSSAGGVVAAASSINYSATPNQGVRVHEDVVTIDKHDRVDMEGPLAYYDDSGEVDKLPAVINESEEAPVQVHLAKVNESAFREFPRQSGEDGNNVSWTNASDWTTSSSASGDMTVSETNPAGDAQAVKFAITAASAEHGEANYTDVSITSDATKRVPLVGVNVDTLNSGAVVDIRFVDADDDYVALEVNETHSNATNASEVIANSTGEAYVTQERLSELDVEGSGDGSLDEIQKVWVRGDGADATVEMFALDAESKSETDLARTYHDHNDDGDLEWETVSEKEHPGYINMTSLDDMGSMFDNSIVYDKRVRNIFYTGEKAATSSNAEFSDAEDYPSYDSVMNASYKLSVPAPIDVSHGTLTLEAEQSVPGERYIKVEYATDVGSTDLNNVSYTSSSAFADGSKGDVHTLASGINAGDESAFRVEVLYTGDEVDALTSDVAGGPVGSSGGFFSTLFGQVVGLGGAVLGALGLRRLIGGS